LLSNHIVIIYRIEISNGELQSIMEHILANNDARYRFYEPSALLQNDEQRACVISLLKKLNAFKFELRFEDVA